MDNPLKKVGQWLVRALISELKQPLEETRKEVADLVKAQNELAQKVERKHAEDPAAKECDLALLDNSICTIIDAARERGYTTASDRRRLARMHDVYQARGGNHGEGLEYEVYCSLMTEEEWRRQHDAQSHLIS